MRRWLKEASPARWFLIVGTPGCGKTTATIKLMDALQESLLCYHICDSLPGFGETLQVTLFIHRLMACLREKVGGFEEELAKLPANHLKLIRELHEGCYERLDADRCDVLFKWCIVEPLKRCTPAVACVIVVDSLDESLLVIRSASPHGLDSSSIAGLLATHAGALPSWIRLVGSTRPVPLILKHLSFSALEDSTIDLNAARHRNDVTHDLQQLVKHELHSTASQEPMQASSDLCRALAHNASLTILSYPLLEIFTSHLSEQIPQLATVCRVFYLVSERLVQRLVEMADGNFQYLRFILNEVGTGHLPALSRLLADYSAISGLDAMHSQYFKRFLRDPNYNIDGLKTILEALTVSRSSLSEKDILHVVQGVKASVQDDVFQQSRSVCSGCGWEYGSHARSPSAPTRYH